MKTLFSLFASVVFTFAPALALADSAIPLGPTPLQILTAKATIQAQQSLASGQTLACAVLFSAPSVAAGEPVVIAWGSVGSSQSAAPAGQSTWTPNGAQQLSIAQKGTWTYSFTFYGNGGASTTCSAQVVVR